MSEESKYYCAWCGLRVDDKPCHNCDPTATERDSLRAELTQAKQDIEVFSTSAAQLEETRMILEAELAEARAETAAVVEALRGIRANEYYEPGFTAAVDALLAAISPAAKALLDAKEAMAELWSALRPNCGPERYYYIATHAIKRARKADEYREALHKLWDSEWGTVQGMLDYVRAVLGKEGE